MRVVYMGNNRVGLQMLQILKGLGENVVGLVAHPPERQKYRDDIIACANLPQERVFDAPRIREPVVLDGLRALEADIAVCGCFGYILRPEVFEIFPLGCINSHISYLPYNRGAFPNVWSIVERTPAGVTLHYIDRGVDTGDLIAQTQVPVEPIDTGETLYHKLEEAAVQLFRETWPLIRSRTASRTPQAHTKATLHKIGDVEAIDRIDMDRTYTGRELIDILRARTFPPFRGAYFVEDGRKVFLRLNLEYSE